MQLYQTDFGYNWLDTIRDGEQKDKPDGWKVKVHYDSKTFYYDVDESDKEEFVDWCNSNFQIDDKPNYRMYWR